MSQRTVFTTRVNGDRRLEHVGHVIERRVFVRREEDRLKAFESEHLIARGSAATLAELQAKLAARGYPTEGASHA